MADRTASGNIVEERNNALALRRSELQIMRMQATVLETEIAIEQKTEEIGRLREQAAATVAQLEMLKQEYAAKKEHLNG